MSIKNKVLVRLHLEDGCSQSRGEVNSAWRPINFDIYSGLFAGMIEEAIEEWLSVNTMMANVQYEIIFSHFVERDAAGAVHSEYFLPLQIERESL